MQLTSALCYVLLTITMTATCIEAEDRKHELEERSDRKLSRREATIFINSIPERGVDRFHNPKVIYRRYSKPRYRSKPKYGSPRPKYGPPKSTRKPVKKYRKKITSKYGPPSHKKRTPKPRYGPPKRQVMKPAHGLPKDKPSHTLPSITYHPEPMGFGEPPRDDQQVPDYNNFQIPGLADSQKPGFQNSVKQEFTRFKNPDFNDFHEQNSGNFYKPASSHFQQNFNDFQKPSANGYQKENFDIFVKSKDYSTQGYGEPPVDSYGAPIKPNLHDLTYPTAHSDTFNHFDQDTFSSTLQSWKSYQQDQKIDNKYAFSMKYPASTIPDSDIFITPVPSEAETELNLNSYSDIFNYRQTKDKIKKPYTNVKIMRKPWKDNRKVNDEIIVGGQYAEPPAIHVPTFRSRDPEFPSDDDSAFPGDLSYSELLASATSSPYVNYKNSNMAFSPQNLNDAFSSR